MVDRFLEQHVVSPDEYAISGPFAPASIRDQMVRAVTLAERLLEGRIRDNDRPVVVVGAGAGGLSAALTLASARVPVVVVDRRDQTFALQAGCTTRWIDPTQYDWPATHWTDGQLPPTTTPTARKLALAFQAAPASKLALSWRGTVEANLRAGLPVTLQMSTSVDRTTYVGPGHVEVVIDPGPPIPAAAVVWAIGLSAERTGLSSGAFRSFGFWEVDPFEDPAWATAPQTVLVAGRGDGALQEVLRLLTGYGSARQLWSALTVAVDASAVTDVERSVLSAQNQADRMALLGDGRHDHAGNQRCEDLVQSTVDTFVGAAGEQELTDRLDDHLEQRFGTNRPSVLLAHPCTHVTNCYALNRFLVGLVERLVADTVLRRITSVGVAAVDPSDPTRACVNSAGDCWDHPHDVVFEGRPDCENDADGTTRAERFDRVVLRIGQERRPLPQHWMRQDWRELMPYWIDG